MVYRRKNKGINTRFYRTYGFTRAYWNKLKAGNPKLRLKAPARKSRSRRRKTVSAYRGVPRAILRPPYFRNLAPRVRTTHVNQLSLDMYISAIGDYTTNDPVGILPLRLRDPDGTKQSQVYPENFTEMSRLYRTYRVYGVKIYISVHGLTNTEDEKFILAVYSINDKDGLLDPYRKTQIDSWQEVNSIMQTKATNMRTKMISDSGTTGNRRNNVFNTGYWSIAGIMDKKPSELHEVDMVGQVNPGGGSGFDPIAKPVIWIRGFSPRSDGFQATRPYQLKVTCVFYCEWSDRQKELEPSFTSVTDGDEITGNTPP